MELLRLVLHIEFNNIMPRGVNDFMVINVVKLRGHIAPNSEYISMEIVEARYLVWRVVPPNEPIIYS